MRQPGPVSDGPGRVVSGEEAVTTDSLAVGEPARYAFAALVETDRATILADYVRGLEAAGSSVPRDPEVLERALAEANQILTDVIESLRAGRVRIDNGYKLIAWEGAGNGIAPAMAAHESRQAAMILFETMLVSILRHVAADSVDLLWIVLRTLNHNLTMRMWETSGAHTGQLLNRVEQAQVGERRRIARELHDRVGSGLSVAHRQLDLFHIYRDTDQAKAADRAEKAHRAVLNSMDSLRAVISDLRLDSPPATLQEALASCVDSISTSDVSLRLRVNGDESWVPAAIGDEAVLIISDMIHNAVARGHAAMVLITVDIAPHELRAVVDDDGHGLGAGQLGPADGAALSSIQDRVAELGGAATVTTQPHQGTRVEFVVPLTQHRETCPHIKRELDTKAR